MSANLLNPATPPGPGANAAPSAAVAKSGAAGPLAGFEALLAGLFGEQGSGVVSPASAGPGKAVPTSKADKTTQAGQAADATATPDTVPTVGSDGASTTVPDALLALLVPVPTAALVGDAATAVATTQGGPAANGSAFGGGAATSPQLADTLLTGDPAITGSSKPGVDKASSFPANLNADATTTASDPAAAAKPETPSLPTGRGSPPGPAAPAPAGLLALDALGAQAAATPVEAKVADAISPGAREIAAKSAGQAIRPAGLEAPRVDAAASPAVARTGDASQASSSGAGGNGPGGGADREARPAATEIKGSPADPAPVTGGLDTQSTTTPAMLIHAAAALRASPQTVATLAAQIARKLDGRSSRFDVQLDPAGLGKVDVRIEIGASGRMTAAMSFDTPQAAAELRARAGELQKALEQAGFDLSGGMSFDVAGEGGRGAQARQDEAGQSANAAFRGRAFQAALETGGEAVAPNPLNLRRTTPDGVDIRI